ncbi:MAG TPA: peptidoglycan-binding domain-containing protein, partial [Myxococcota bacterium]
MVSRTTNGAPSPSPTLGADDGRLDQQREQQINALQEAEIVKTRDDGARVVDHVVKELTGQLSGADAKHDPARVIAQFQREAGLPITGRIDSATMGALKEQRGISPPPPQPSSTPSSPQTSAPTTSAPTPATRTRDDVTGSRQARSVAESVVRARVDGAKSEPKVSQALGGTSAASSSASSSASPSSASSSTKASASATSAAPAQRTREASTTQARPAFLSSGAGTAAKAAAASTPSRGDQSKPVIDPSKLLLSLIAAGFLGKKGSADDGVKAFQAQNGLPPTGKLDDKTMEALTKAGLLDDAKKPVDRPDSKQVRRALVDNSAKNAADRDVTRDPTRPQAATNKPITSSEVAARAAIAEASDLVKESTRLDTALAQHSAAERGVQEGTGDPQATAGNGDVDGAGAGVAGTGGASGGNIAGTEGLGARGLDGDSVGDESAVGNAK